MPALVSVAAERFSQWESVPAGLEEVTEMVDFWLVSTGGASAGTCSSTSTSPGETLREKEAKLAEETDTVEVEDEQKKGVTQNLCAHSTLCKLEHVV